jgi:hypothetical protein
MATALAAVFLLLKFTKEKSILVQPELFLQARFQICGNYYKFLPIQPSGQ